MVYLQTRTTFCISPGSIHNFHRQRNLHIILTMFFHLHFHYRVHLKEYTILLLGKFDKKWLRGRKLPVPNACLNICNV